ncbi:AGAP009951-PA, partial [Anopheles gambiae str. PEST]
HKGSWLRSRAAAVFIARIAGWVFWFFLSVFNTLRFVPVSFAVFVCGFPVPVLVLSFSVLG